MLHDIARRDVDDLAVGGPARHIERGDDADGVALREVRHVAARRLDRACGLVAEPRGEVRFLQVSAVAEHHLCAVQAYGSDRDLHLVGGRRRNLNVIDAQHVCGAVFVKAYNASHGLILW